MVAGRICGVGRRQEGEEKVQGMQRQERKKEEEGNGKAGGRHVLQVWWEGGRQKGVVGMAGMVVVGKNPSQRHMQTQGW